MSRTYEQLEPVISALDERIKTNLGAFPTDTAEGSIASFADGADGIPLKSLVVDINPVQDLHGYDSPWPAGGGVNTLDPESLIEQYPNSAYGLAITRSGEWITINGAYSGEAQAPQFRFMQKKDGSTFDDTYWAFPDSNSSNNVSGQISKADSNKTLTIKLNNMIQGTTYNLRFRLMGVMDTTRPTDYAPYENICPISGWTGAKVTRCGKNLLSLVESEMVSSGWNIIFPISLKAGTYIISCQNQFGASTKGAAVALVDDNATTAIKWLSWYEFGDSTFVGRVTTITEEEASKIKNLQFSLRASGATYNDIVQGNIKLELGSTATPYEPYTGQTYPITFPSEAGTIYGGYVDVTGGELVMTHCKYIFTGDEDIYKSQSYAGNPFVFDSPTKNTVAPFGEAEASETYCNILKTEKSKYHNIGDNSLVTNAVSGYSQVLFRGNIFGDTVESAKAKLKELYENGTPMVVVGKIRDTVADNFRYPLTPLEIKTLLGQNNIWADTGDTNVVYRADTSAYIAKKIAEAISALS